MSDKPNPLKWREHAAVAHMHTTLATSKLQSVKSKDSPDLEKTMRDIEKAIECIEASHEAAMLAHEEYQRVMRYRNSFKGVRLTSIKKSHGPMTATIAELKKP